MGVLSTPDAKLIIVFHMGAMDEAYNSFKTCRSLQSEQRKLATAGRG